MPTARHKSFPAYQSGREFDDALIEQLRAEREAAARAAEAAPEELMPGGFVDPFKR